MWRRYSVSLAGLLILWSACIAQAAPIPDELICPRTDSAPTLDGLLDDPCWETAARITGFTRPLSDGAGSKTIGGFVCLDSEALYLAFRCEEPNPGALQATAEDGGENVWQDDCVEIWIKAADSQLELDQFIVNAAGARQTVRSRGATMENVAAGWSAATDVGDDSWSAELAIPFTCLQAGPLTPGDLLQVKFGREARAGGPVDLATWPPKSEYGSTDGYGRLYIERANVLPNADMSEMVDGKIAAWRLNEANRELFSSVTEGETTAIRFEATGRYSAGEQSLRLRPDSTYRLDARVKGAGQVYLRVRTSEKRGEPSTAYTVTSKPGESYSNLTVSFPTGEDGSALVIIGTYEGLARGEVRIADLRISRDVIAAADGPAITLSPGSVVQVTKVPVTDCRALRGFVAAPVDGRLDSYNWNMDVWEYGMPGAGAGVGYRYRNNDGLHITLADSDGVDAVQIRRGARVKLYRDAESYDAPGGAPLVWEFEGKAKTSRAVFPERVRSDRFSFFELADGLIADVSFLRVSRYADWPTALNMPSLSVIGRGDAGALAPHLERRFSAEDPVYAIGAGDGKPVSVDADRTIHLVGEPLAAETSLDMIGLQLTVPDAPTGCPLTAVVQDPLNPRQELMGVDLTIERVQQGSLWLVLDFPNQVIPAGKQLWVSLTFGAPVTIENANVELYEVRRARAVPEALAFRKFVMKGLFCELSEARQWNALGRNTDLEKFYRENRWGPGVKDLAETIAQCKLLGPDDDTVRCYDEWFWRRVRDLPAFEPVIDVAPGAPEWAVLARQAWLTAREVPKWWLDNRLVPTGEMGGLVGDDSDMYQNYADFPMFETGGVAGEILGAAAGLAELAEEENLEAGLNRRTMDPLHAYEEGVNHEALMLWWFYGDPIYFERCLLAAKSMPALTVVTDKGHRHFKNQDCGAEDLRIDRALGVDGHAHPLMWHPCFEVAWYNGSPTVLQYLDEWAMGWLDHMEPGKYATSVDVATENATETSDRPLYGGYGGQASAHNFLYWITGDTKYLGPVMDHFRKGDNIWPARKNVPELWHRGALDDVENREPVLAGNPVSKAVALGDKAALCEALRGDIAELQRFGTMYKDAEVFTDRVFLDAISNATQCYTGGWATRNKYNHTHAASWEGFGTDFAALVLKARPESFKVLVYNFRDEPVTGRIRLWTLDHGRYRLTLGPDADQNDEADSATRTETLEIARATPISLTLPGKTVTVLELTQVEALEGITKRPDLALAARELALRDGVLRGVVHNIGGADSPAFEITLADAQGEVRERQTLNALAAPLDLEPKHAGFEFTVGEADIDGWTVTVDPGNQVAEVFGENNAAICDGDALARE